jgi:hypothetical protein
MPILTAPRGHHYTHWNRGMGQTTAGAPGLVLVNGVWVPTTQAGPPQSGVMPGQPYLLTANQYLQSTAVDIAAAQEACNAGDTAACGQASDPAAILATNLAQYCAAGGGANTSPECANPATGQATVSSLAQPLLAAPKTAPVTYTPATVTREQQLASGVPSSSTGITAGPQPSVSAAAGTGTPVVAGAAAAAAPSTDLINGIPNWALLAAAGAVLLMVMKK